MKKKIISILLVFAMAVSLVPNTAQAKENLVVRNDENDPSEKVEGAAEVIEYIAEAAQMFCEVGEKSKIISAFAAGGGVTFAVSGCIAILKAAGVIEDPTEAKLEKILEGVQNIEKQLNDMKDTLTKLGNEIAELKVSDEEHARALKALNYLGQWNSFKASYLKDLADEQAAYTSMIGTGVKEWWEKDEREAIALTYVKSGDEDLVAVSSDATDKVPEKADNGMQVELDNSFIIPADVMPSTKNAKYDVNTFEDVYAGLASTAILNAANEKKLIAEDVFYDQWLLLSDADKKAKADAWGADLLTPITYNVAAKIMSSAEGHKFTSVYMQKYSEFADELISSTNGVVLLADALMNMYCFEGEIKDSVEKIIASMTVDAGLYGQLALSVASQDSNIKISDRQTIQKKWIDTINKLHNIKSNLLTGDNGYCYPAGASLKYGTAVIKSEARPYWTELDDGFGMKYRVEDYWYDSWHAEDNNDNNIDMGAMNLCEETPTKVVYDNYLARNASAPDSEKSASFAAYLNKFGVGMPDDFNDKITTSYYGPKSFPLADQLSMTAHKICGGYFDDKKDYAIFDGSGKPQSEKFVLHDCVDYGYVDVPAGGAIHKEEILCARAMYVHSDGWWRVDNICTFNMNCGYNSVKERRGFKGGRKQYRQRCYFDKHISFLRKTAPQPSESAGNIETSGEKRYEKHILTEDIKDKKIKFVSSELEYTGKSQKPVVRSINGTAVEEGIDYKIKVNKTAKKIGSYKATITGKGQYTGSKTVSFKIVKATNGLKLTGKYTTAKKSKLKKKAVTIKRSKLMSVKKATGKLTYSIVSVYDNKYKKRFTIDKKTGALKIKKGTKAGEYEVFIKVKAAGSKTTKSKTEEVRATVTVK